MATSSAVEAYPACDAGRVVYTYAPVGGNADIRLYDIGTGQTKVVSNQPWNEWRPAISGSRVVWQAWPNQPDTTEGIQIFGTNLDTGQDFVVTNRPDHQTAPVISGSTVAWEDIVNGQREIWWRDIATTMQQEIPVDGDAPSRDPAGGLRVRQEGRLPEQLNGTVEHRHRESLLLHRHPLRKTWGLRTGAFFAPQFWVQATKSGYRMGSFYERDVLWIKARSR